MNYKPLLKNHPDIESIDWRFCDKNTYIDIEDLMTRDVLMFDPFAVDNFLSNEDFLELQQICKSYNLKNLDYNQHLQKWEQQIEIPEPLLTKIFDKIKKEIGTDDVHMGYYFYTHHQISEDGRRPKLPLHIDYSEGPYFVGLHIDSNRDWDFIAQDKLFTLKQNQAVFAQTQLDYHWRPSWNSNDPNQYYSVLLFHLINRNNWSVPNDSSMQNRDEGLNRRFPNLGPGFYDDEDYARFRKQQRFIFDKLYVEWHSQSDLPPIPWEDIPTAEDAAKEKRIKNIGIGE